MRGAVKTALVAAALLCALPASADGPRVEAPGTMSGAPPGQPVILDHTYDPAAHGGLPHGTYLLMTRGVRRRSTGTMVTGIIFTSLGAVAMATGTGIYFGNGGCDDRPPQVLRTVDDFGSPPCSVHAARTAGMAILLAGAITTAIGVPLWIFGASDAPWVDAAGKNERLRVTPSLMLAPRGVGLGFRF